MTPSLAIIENRILQTRTELDQARADETDRMSPLKVRLGELESGFSQVAFLTRQMLSAPETLAGFDGRVAVWAERRNELLERAARGIAKGKTNWETHLGEAARLGGLIATAPELRRGLERQLADVPQAEIDRITASILQ
jgi:hypothetical protein